MPFTEADRQAAAARYEARAAQLRAQADRIDGGPAPAKKATKAAKAAPASAAPDLTGSNGLSTDPAVRAVQVENRIRQAYRDVQARASGGQRRRGWVALADLREHQLVRDLDRPEVDKALRGLVDDVERRERQGIHLTPADDGSTLTSADRAAALRLGGDDNHYLRIDHNDPTPLPAAPAKAAPAKKATPRKATKATPPTKAAPSGQWRDWTPQQHYARAEEARAAGNNAEWRRHRSIADSKNRQIVTEGRGVEHLRSLAERDAARRFLRSLLRGQLNQLAEQLGISTEGSADAVIARILSARFGEG